MTSSTNWNSPERIEQTVDTVLGFFRDKGYQYEYVAHEKEEGIDVSFTLNIRGDHKKVNWIDMKVNEVNDGQGYTFTLDIGKKDGDVCSEQVQAPISLEEIETVLQRYIRASDTIAPDRE